MGRYLAFRSQARAGYESDRFRLMLYDRTGAANQQASEPASQPVSGSGDERSGAPSAQALVKPVSVPGDGVLLALMPKYDRWVDEFVWGPDSKAVYLASNDAGRTLVLRFQFDGDPEEPIRIVTSDGEFSDLQISRDGNFLVATRMSVNQPAEIDAMSPGLTAEPLSPEEAEQQQEMEKFSVVSALNLGGSSPRRQLTHLNDALVSTLDLPRMESFGFAGAGGTPVQGFLLRPPNFDETRTYPVKFLIHGGPQGSWGGCVELPVESGADGGERICGGDGESAGVDRVWAGVCGWGEWRLGWEGVCRSDEGDGFCGEAVPVYR